MFDLLNKFGHKVSKLFGDQDIGTYGLSNHEATKLKDVFSEHPFANILPYEAYDENTGIFIGKNSFGFTIESEPIAGCESVIQKEVASLFEDIIEEGASIQCMLVADHRIDPFLNRWEKPNNNVAILKEIAAKRSNFFKTSDNVYPRIFRFILSYSISSQCPASFTLLQEKKEKILKTLKSFTFAFCWTPKHFLETVGGLINFTWGTDVKKREWNKFQTLASQLTTGGSLKITEEGLEWKNETEALFKSFRVTDYPDNWSLAQMTNLIGNQTRDNYRIKHPFYIHYGVYCPYQSQVEREFSKRSMLVEQQGKSQKLLRFIPQLSRELNECSFVRSSTLQGSRFVMTQLSVGIWAPKTQISHAEQSLKSLFRINEFKLTESRTHLLQFISTLPLMWGEVALDMKGLGTLKTTLSCEPGNFVPIQGEWAGTHSPGMLLLGRRGQLMNWNPFDNPAGNSNISIIGPPGSGKSVMMQELLLQGLRTGIKAFVLDIGRSFEKMNALVNGQYIHFGRNSHVCLNPFTNISQEDDIERNDSFSVLKHIISRMAAPTEGTNDYQNSLIGDAISYVWEKKQNKATITDVAEWLTKHEDQTARILGVTLTPFTKRGVYAQYFEGENNVNFTNPMVLIEFEELNGKKDLQEVIFQIFIMIITDKIFLGDRKTRFYICIDEAAEQLKSKQAAAFIEILSRRVRKYNGSLMTGTQSVEDFYVSPGAKAAFDNSDWHCFLRQKVESIARMDKMTEPKKRALETLTKVDGEYSEVMICDATGNFSIARLVLDPFSNLLYTTTPKDFAQIKDLTNSGMSHFEALNKVLAKNEKK